MRAQTSYSETLYRFDDPEPPIGTKVWRYGHLVTRRKDGLWHYPRIKHGWTWGELFYTGGDSDFVAKWRRRKPIDTHHH